MGDPATDARLQQAERALTSSGRFSDAEVRRRYRSIANPSEILVILFVDEHAAVEEDDLTPGPLKRLRFASMWVPVLNHVDGYGFTYGGRISVVDALGRHSRVSVPLTWGGERRAAVELERTFDGFITLARAGLSTFRRVNPHFDQPDSRLEARGEAERAWTNWLRTGASARSAQVEFGSDHSRHTALGVNLTWDTRVDPSFPRNAVHVRVGWERLTFESGNAGRWLADLRGYVGIGGSAVLALRGQLTRADSPTPFSEQVLLGGSDSLRGYRAGHRAGDSVASVSAEARVPLNSPLSFGRFGVKGFFDAGTAWLHGSRLADQHLERGVGGGLYFGAAALVADLDVAWPEQGKPRLHFGLGVSF